MTKIAIETSYSVSGSVILDLPEGKTWNDVTSWYIKYGTVYAAFNHGDYQELGQVGEVSMDTADFKRPDSAAVYAVSDDDSIDYDTLIDEQG
jgi:hypothetical protein